MTRIYDIRLEYSMRVICHGLVQTTQQAKIAAEVREDEGTNILVDAVEAVEAEIVSRDIALAVSCWFHV